MTLVDPDNESTFKGLEIASDLRAARAASDGILREVESARYSPDAVFAIKLALEEAMTNALKHGNKGDSSKRIAVRYAVAPDRCVIIVRDQGQGFDPDGVPDCTCADRISLPNGRGIMLMRAYMNDVSYRNHGTEVYLMKRNE
jgi:serine/threonine-protein kinase RsbW